MSGEVHLSVSGGVLATSARPTKPKEPAPARMSSQREVTVKAATKNSAQFPLERPAFWKRKR